MTSAQAILLPQPYNYTGRILSSFYVKKKKKKNPPVFEFTKEITKWIRIFLARTMQLKTAPSRPAINVRHRAELRQSTHCVIIVARACDHKLSSTVSLPRDISRTSNVLRINFRSYRLWAIARWHTSRYSMPGMGRGSAIQSHEEKRNQFDDKFSDLQCSVYNATLPFGSINFFLLSFLQIAFSNHSVLPHARFANTFVSWTIRRKKLRSLMAVDDKIYT